jgi:hypothetical protein
MGITPTKWQYSVYTDFGMDRNLSDWCLEYIGKFGQSWAACYQSNLQQTQYMFANEEDAMLFNLRWSQ